MTPKGIVCPVCTSIDLQVTYTKRLPNGAIRRYRRCRQCNARIVTLERPEITTETTLLLPVVTAS